MRILFWTSILTFSFLSCEKSENCEDPKLDCSNIRCFAFWSYFEFKLVDKTTGSDLVFGTNPRYSFNDIKLFADAAKTIPLNFTTDNNKKSIQTMTAREEMYLEIKGGSIYKLSASFIANDCCSNRVRTLSIDGLMTCSCCTDVVPLGVN